MSFLKEHQAISSGKAFIFLVNVNTINHLVFFVYEASLSTLLAKMHQNKIRFDEKKIQDAFSLAKNLHEGQFRLSGEPYINHPLAVAILLADWGADEATIIAALLHDTVEDTKHTISAVEQMFGKDVRNLVYGITKISKGALRDKKDMDRSIESLRRWFDIMQTDVRVAIVKLFDRWHNMQTLSAHKNPTKQKAIAQETMEIYARIAKKLCMYDLALALEDLALPYILSTKYYHKLQNIQKQHSAEGEVIEKNIKQQLNAYDYHNKIISISHTEITLGQMYQEKFHKKQNLKGYIPFTFTVITPTIEDCYYILFLIHNIWKVKEHGVSDFISTPSASRYQALHTSILYKDGINLIFKIRTQEMQDYYQKGITRFCFSSRGIENNFPWIQNLSYVTKIDKGHSKKFFEKLKQDVLGNYITVYTIADEPFLVPEKSTVLDAAFYIHGNQSLYLSKAYVNGLEVKLGSKLVGNSIIHFIFDKKMNITEGWSKYVTTALATSMTIKGLKQTNKRG